jgi:hypothetical protein
MGTPDTNPSCYQAQLRERRLALRESLRRVSTIICAAMVEQGVLIGQMTVVNEELNERWRVHLSVHQPDESGRCEECDLYDPAELAPAPETGVHPNTGAAIADLAATA